jgi:hypothetical protein
MAEVLVGYKSHAYCDLIVDDEGPVAYEKDSTAMRWNFDIATW